MEKQCAHCKESKPVALFNKGRKSDYTSNCTACCLFFKEKALAERAAFRERKRQHDDASTKICGRCRQCKPVADFNQGRVDEFSSNCSDCCAKMNVHFAAYADTEKGKATQARHQKTEKRKVSKARHKSTALFAETKVAYEPRRKELRAAEYARIHTDPGLNLEHGIGVKIGKMIKGERDESKTVMSYAEFANRGDMMAHFESTFVTGMSFANFGKHLVNGPPVWNVGHRIARFHYDHNDPEDVRRCWMKCNLFAQWAKENIQAKVTLPDEATLVQLQPIWPVSWNNQLPSPEDRVRMERALYVQ